MNWSVVDPQTSEQVQLSDATDSNIQIANKLQAATDRNLTDAQIKQLIAAGRTAIETNDE